MALIQRTTSETEYSWPSSVSTVANRLFIRAVNSASGTADPLSECALLWAVGRLDATRFADSLRAPFAACVLCSSAMGGVPSFGCSRSAASARTTPGASVTKPTRQSPCALLPAVRLDHPLQTLNICAVTVDTERIFLQSLCSTVRALTAVSTLASVFGG